MKGCLLVCGGDTRYTIELFGSLGTAILKFTASIDELDTQT